MKVLILHGTIAKHDAIGIDIAFMAQILSNENQVFVYAIFCLQEQLTTLPIDEVFEFIRHPENLIIYHHSIYWALGEEILMRSKAKVIFKYHNITPPEYYESYSKLSANECKAGREQTCRLSKRFSKSLWLSDSNYNSQDLNGISQKKTVAPFHQIEHWKDEKPDYLLLENLRHSKNLKILFVGRIAPNKGHLKITEILQKYSQMYDAEVEAYFIGKSYTPAYSIEVISNIFSKSFTKNVKIVGEVTKNQLMSYYMGCDLFLCLSEHEGFCVPLIEAQYFGLPIIALDIPAVRETLGAGQMIFDYEPHVFASALRTLKTNRDIREILSVQGRKNFETRFTHEKIREDFVCSLPKELVQ